MKKIPAAMLAAIGLCTISSSAMAFPSSWNFTHQPSGYFVHVRDTGSTMYLKGSNQATGKTFKIRVSPSGHVTGEFDGKLVDYVLDRRTEASVVLASR